MAEILTAELPIVAPSYRMYAYSVWVENGLVQSDSSHWEDNTIIYLNGTTNVMRVDGTTQIQQFVQALGNPARAFAWFVQR